MTILYDIRKPDVQCNRRRQVVSERHNLNVSGDGTKLETHSKRYGTKTCSCKEYNCDCPRFYNDKSASIGYDSYHDTYIFGYNFYQLNSWDIVSNSEGQKDTMPPTLI